MTEQQIVIAFGMRVRCADGSEHGNTCFDLRDGSPMFYGPGPVRLEGSKKVSEILSGDLAVPPPLYVGFWNSYQEAA